MTNIPAPGADLATDSLRTYVIMARPGMAPVVKGPLPDKKWVEDMLRELYQQYADAQCMVIDMPNTSWPQSGIEWIDMYGDKRRTPIRAVLAAVPVSEPPQPLHVMAPFAPTAGQREAALAALLTRIDDAAESYERFGAICQFEGSPMIYADTLTEIVTLRGEYHAATAQGKAQ